MSGNGWIDSWICENQPSSNLLIFKPKVGMTVGFAKTNSVQLSYLEVYGWNDGWFCENQPRSNLRTLKHMVGMTIGLTKTNRFPTLVHERQRLD